MVTVVIGHRLATVRRRIRSALGKAHGYAVVGECGDGETALDLVRRLSPDILFLEDTSPGLSAMEVAGAIREERLPTKVVLITASGAEWTAGELIEAGVAGCVEAADSPGDIRDAAEVVARGGLWLRQRSLDSSACPAHHSRLTAREREVLGLIGDGLRNTQIADRLVLSRYTVEHHITSIYTKLGLTNRAEAILYAVRHGLVVGDESSKDKR